jgi:uncharacterized membrane protein
MLIRKTYFPALAIAGTLILFMGLINLFQIIQHRQVPYVGQMAFFGWDYRTFYDASQALQHGGSPYQVEIYVTPPVPAVVGLALARLDFNVARQVVFWLSLAALALAYWIASHVFHASDRSALAAVVLAGLGAMLFSYPVYFLLDRGNIDGFVALLICLGILLHRRSEALSGASFALAISFKLYPGLLLVPLLVAKRGRLVAATLIGLVVLVLLPSPALWRDFLFRFVERSDLFRSDQNGSLASTFLFVAWILKTQLTTMGMSVNEKLFVDVTLFLSTAFYCLALLVIAYVDFKIGRRDFPAMAVIYFPLMVAVPKLAYHYEFVILLLMIPLLCDLWKTASDRTTQRLLGVIALGIILSQSQAVALDALTGKDASHFIPGLGLFLVIVSCVLYQLHALESRKHRLIPPLDTPPAAII